MQSANDQRLEALLELLLEAAAPLPHGASKDLSRNNVSASLNTTPRELLVSFQQLTERLTDSAEQICGAKQSAVVSYNGENFHLHSHKGLDSSQVRMISQPYFDVLPNESTEFISLEGNSSNPTPESPQSKSGGISRDVLLPSNILASVWQEVIAKSTAKTMIVDQYGDTIVYLLLGWPSLDSEIELPTLTPMFELYRRVANGALRFQRKAASSRRRARWVTASRTLTEALLNGADEEEALTLVAEAAKGGAGADAALIFLPSVGGEWACEIAIGSGAQPCIGMPFPGDRIFRGVLADGHGMILRSAAKYLSSNETLANYGPMVIAPLNDTHTPQGALALLRKKGREPFGPDDLPSTEAFASQTSLALEVASARHSQSLAILLEDRDRISRDLHDFAVQQLFATGMKLDFLREGALSGALSSRRMSEGLEEAMASLEDSVRQIRSIVHNLKEHDRQAIFTDRLEQEASRARHFLGFAPSLLFELDGFIINPGAPTAPEKLQEMSARVDDSITDDAVAIIREALSNIARHAHARATRVEVEVSGHGAVGELVISIIDDGQGVDPSQTRSSGLANMSKRARLHGGSFAVGAGPRGRGTSLVWRVPLAQ